jgi:hypothetical protein
LWRERISGNTLGKSILLSANGFSTMALKVLLTTTAFLDAYFHICGIYFFCLRTLTVHDHRQVCMTA